LDSIIAPKIFAARRICSRLHSTSLCKRCVCG